MPVLHNKKECVRSFNRKVKRYVPVFRHLSMYTIRMTKTFRRDTERCRKRGYNNDSELTFLFTGTHSDIF